MKKLLTFKTNRWIKNNKSVRSATDYRKSEEIGFIFTVEDRSKHDVVKNFIKRLETDGKHVEILAFLPEKAENHEFLFDFFTKKDVSFWGNYSSELVQKFADKTFDYLLHIDFENTDFINGILAMSKAKCRVGTSADQNRFYEMVINMNSSQRNYQQLADEMYNYISILT